MKRVFAFVPLLLVAVLLPVSAHAGVAVASVTFVNAITFDAESDFPLTVCLDGVAQGEEISTGGQLGPVDIAPGDYNVAFVQGTDCSDEDPFAEGAVTFEPDANVTVMGFWGPEGREVVLLPNDVSCIEAGLSRLTFRHGAATEDVDLFVTPEGGASTEVISDVGPGEQSVAELAVGTYSEGVVSESLTGDPIVDLGPADLGENESRTAYLFGGADGDIGIFFGPVLDLDPCVEPTTSSTSTSVAVAAETRPTFTG